MYPLATSIPYPLSTILLSYILLKTSKTFTTLIISQSSSEHSSDVNASSSVSDLPSLMTLGSVICSLLLTLLSPSKKTAVGLGVRYPISFSHLWVMASSGVVTIQVESSISATLVLEESSQTAIASRGVVSRKNLASWVHCKKIVKPASGWLSLSQEIYLRPGT